MKAIVKKEGHRFRYITEEGSLHTHYCSSLSKFVDDYYGTDWPILPAIQRRATLFLTLEEYEPFEVADIVRGSLNSPFDIEFE